MISGPVDSPRAVALITAPIMPAAMPNSAASATMRSEPRVHWRAATAGAMIIAAIRTTPTICSPTTTASAIMTVSTTSSASTGRPSVCGDKRDQR